MSGQVAPCQMAKPPGAQLTVRCQGRWQMKRAGHSASPLTLVCGPTPDEGLEPLTRRLTAVPSCLLSC